MFSVAIIGRPNVGKSTLFNRLVGKKLALVDDRPGVTRDRREGEGSVGDLSFAIIDTAGLEEATATSLEGRMREQTEAAIEQADVILFMIDARVGVTPQDRFFVDLIRKSGKPIVVLANKAEGKQGEAGVLEAFQLGLGDPVPLSAEHGEGMVDLYQALLPFEKREDGFSVSPDTTVSGTRPPAPTAGASRAASGGLVPLEPEEELDISKPLRVAIVGRPNAGKSTLINRLLGEERLLTGPEAGITRDSIAVDFHHNNKAFKLWDTAGLRKKARVEDKLEKLSVADSLRAIRFAEVVIVLMDATRPFEEQDLRIADLVEREGRAVVIGMNKSDLIERSASAITALREDADHWLPQLKGVQILPVSGLTGASLDRLLGAVEQAYQTWNRRIGTSDLNRWFEQVLSQNPPPAVQGRRIRLKYVTQVKTRPPTFTVFGNQLSALPQSYKRYLVNSLRQSFDLHGIPIRILTKGNENPYDKSKS